MLSVVSSIACFVLFAGWQPTVRAADSAEQIEAKLKTVRKQLKELRRKEKALLDQLEQEKAKVAKARDGYVRVEVKGLLRDQVLNLPASVNPRRAWTITFGRTTWYLDFQDKKEFLKIARANEGKTVVVTGTLVEQWFRAPPGVYGGRPIGGAFSAGRVRLLVATIKATKK
jgi:hypothetical protein